MKAAEGKIKASAPFAPKLLSGHPIFSVTADQVDSPFPLNLLFEQGI